MHLGCKKKTDTHSPFGTGLATSDEPRRQRFRLTADKVRASVEAHTGIARDPDGSPAVAAVEVLVVISDAHLFMRLRIALEE
jgi:hypothetical protein